jgi:hypothetical protein
MILIKIPFLHRKGIAFYPFILIKHADSASDQVLINHERIHLRQQIELLILPFYIIYLTHYLINLVKMKDHEKAYRSIIFEKEAYAQQGNAEYLILRKPWSFIRFL